MGWGDALGCQCYHLQQEEVYPELELCSQITQLCPLAAVYPQTCHLASLCLFSHLSNELMTLLSIS